MSHVAARMVGRNEDAGRYQRHRPEQILLYQIVDEVLPEQPMRQWVLSFPFQLRFLFASRPEIMGRVLGLVYRVIATHLVRKAGHSYKTARTGAITLIQRFGSALNLNVHFHMLFLDGVYVDGPHGLARFCWVKAPPLRNSLSWRTPSLFGSGAFWSAMACWNGMRRTVTWPRMRWTRIR